MTKLSKTIMLSTVTAFLALGQANASLTISELEAISSDKTKTVKGHHGISDGELKAIQNKVKPYTHLDLNMNTRPRVTSFEIQGRTYDSYTWIGKGGLLDPLNGHKTLVVTDAPVLNAAGVTSLTKFLATEADQEAVAAKKAQVRSAKKQISKMQNKRAELKTQIQRVKDNLANLESN